MNRPKLALLVLLCACPTAPATVAPAAAGREEAAGGPPVVLAAPGHKSVIVVRDGWKPAVWYDWGGHEILRRFVKEVAGVELPVVSASEVATEEARAKFDTRIWVGRQPEVERVIGAELDRLDDDGFVIRAVGAGDVYVAGKKWWGDNWAAHDLLERYAGCRWYGPEPEFWKPQEQGTVGLFDVVPKKERIELPAGADVVEEPSYKMRWFRFMPLHSFRLRYRDQFHHALVGIVDPKKYGQTHPEYFPLIGGERRVPPAGEEFHFQPCVANEEVAELVAAAAVEHFKANPDAGSFSVGMNDTDKFCECDMCLAVAPDTIRHIQLRTAYAFFDFYNRVAGKVEAAGFGDRRLGCLGYAGLSVLPPGSIRMHPMLVPYLTRDSAQLFDPDQVKEFNEIVRVWSGLATRMGIYEYVYGGGYVVPRVYNRYLIANVQNRYGVGVDGFYAESYPNWGLDGPKYWLLSRMLWDHEQDPRALLDEWYANLFGPAAEPMRRYFGFLEETWCTQTLVGDRSNYRWFLDARQLEIFPPDKCDAAWAMLEDAKGRTEDATVRKRITFYKDAFAVTRALSRRYAAAADVERVMKETAGQQLVAALPARLGALQAWLEAPDVAPLLARARSHGTALDDNVIANGGGFGIFDRQPVAAVAELLQQVTAAASEKEGAETVLGDPAGREMAAAFIGELAKAGGFLHVSAVQSAPAVDGTIGPQEWPQAAYSGQFFRVHKLDREPERTTVYAARDRKVLYLAFDLEQDPAAVGAAATGTDAGGWQNPAMLNDDCVSITFTAPGQGFRSIRVNANGAVGFHQEVWEGVVTAAAARKTETGWQAELAVDLEVLGLNPDDPNAGGAVTAAVARYTRRPAAPGADGSTSFRAEASTLWPAPEGEGIIGRGNHPGLMTFVTGPRLVFEPSEAAP